MGPEPYTFALIMAEKMGYFGFKKINIIATDIDESGNFEQIIKQAKYPLSDLSRMPEGILEKYFAKTDDGNYELDHNVKSRLVYYWHDLLTLKPIEENFDAIICKNVLLHFKPEERVEVIKMFHKVLNPGGFFVSEQTQALPEECKGMFEKIVSDANLYKKI
jgi:chemotaxis protein methyltransferase CheR